MPRTLGQVAKYVVNKHKDHYDVYIGRGSDYGNPFIVGTHGTRKEVVEKYEAMLLDNPQLMAQVKEELADKTLGCFCSPKLCHGHVLAWYANRLDEE